MNDKEKEGLELERLLNSACSKYNYTYGEYGYHAYTKNLIYTKPKADNIERNFAEIIVISNGKLNTQHTFNVEMVNAIKIIAEQFIQSEINKMHKSIENEEG